MPGPDAPAFVDRIDGDDFAAWYRERRRAENVRNGQPYFNGPSDVPPVGKHSPSQLLQCHRKVRYRQENAPAERAEPAGIFWVGRRFEADVVLPYLRDVVSDEDVHVQETKWVDVAAETEAGAVRFRGATDPCFVEANGDPLLPTEVKTKETVAHLDGPNRHHRAQVHAYMRGLSEKYDREVTDALVVYGSRKTLDVRAFHEPFDEAFWGTVLDWATAHTGYRDAGELPPADPEYDWECEFCSYAHRCGRRDSPYADAGPTGLLPRFDDYPRERVRSYLRAHDDAALTPTLATAYPGLAAEYDVSCWSCPRCGYETRSPPAGDDEGGPVCPNCADRGTLETLTAPAIGE